MDSDLVKEILRKGSFAVVVKPKARQNAIVKFDDARNVFIVEIKVEAKNNKANIELIKFITKQLKHKVEIVKGFTSKKKILKIV